MVVHVGGADGDPKIADTDAVAFGGEEIVEKRGAFGGVHVVEEHGAAAGEREAEAVDGLVGLRAVDLDDLAGRSFFGEGEFGGLLGEKRGAIGIGEPEGGVFLRERGQRQKCKAESRSEVENLTCMWPPEGLLRAGPF